MYQFLSVFILKSKLSHLSITPVLPIKVNLIKSPMHGLHRSSEKHFLAIKKLQQTYEYYQGWLKSL